MPCSSQVAAISPAGRLVAGDVVARELGRCLFVGHGFHRSLLPGKTRDGHEGRPRAGDRHRSSFGSKARIWIVVVSIRAGR